jgi:hypothetical protein
MTPYQYGANNPILMIDVNGDSLWIQNRGERILYENGKLYNADGSAYSGKALKANKDGTTTLKGFVGKTVNALGTIKGTAEGGSMISKLQSSDNNFSIIRASSSSFSWNDATKAFANQIMSDPVQANTYAALQSAGVSLSGGSGGTIYWNPSGTTLPVVGGTGISGTTDLAHEIFHAQDANQGMSDNRLFYGITRSDWSAVYGENMVRSQLGMPLRTHYVKNLDLSTGSITGTGTRMITPINTPYLPLYPITLRPFIRKP